MIKQVIVVEGKSDIARVGMAVDADMIATEGFALKKTTIEKIRYAYEKRGIIILTDPDGPGERIRQRLSKLFPKALHAFVPKSEASTEDDVGIEDASPESIRKALQTLRILFSIRFICCRSCGKSGLFSQKGPGRRDSRHWLWKRQTVCETAEPLWNYP